MNNTCSMHNNVLRTPPNGHFLRSNGPIILNDGSPLIPTLATSVVPENSPRLPSNTSISNTSTNTNVSSAALATDNEMVDMLSNLTNIAKKLSEDVEKLKNGTQSSNVTTNATNVASNVITNVASPVLSFSFINFSELL